MNNNPFGELVKIFNKLGLQHKMMLFVVTIITVILLITLLVFLNEPTYSVLYTNLEESDAGAIVEQLNIMKVPYQIEDNGKTIKVPKEKVYETRLSLASKGVLGSGVVGYEIFDKSTMGMSEFMQKLNFKRALEGELAKTISTIEGVDGARVHIVIPQKTVFLQEEKKPTASVVLKLRSGNISRSHIISIVNLVSSSVEGLDEGKVTLLDTKGNLLSKDTEENSFGISSTKQYEIKQSVESYLAQKAQGILDNVLGFGNSIVQVNADLNFNQVEKTMELYDPESQVAVSEQVIKTENTGRASRDTSAQISENTTTNYEINKTIQRVIEGTGNINRLSVAVVVNDVVKEVQNKGTNEVVFEPRSQEQLDKLEGIVKNAVGLNTERQDQFSLVNIPFQTNNIEEVPVEESSILTYDMDKYMNMLIIIVAIIASVFVLKSLMNRIKNEKIVIGTFTPNNMAAVSAYGNQITKGNVEQSLPAPPKKVLAPMGDLEDEISDDAIRKKMQHEKISNYVMKNPADAAKLINAWLHEDEL